MAATAYTSGVTAESALIQYSIDQGYTPSSSLSPNDVPLAILTNFLKGNLNLTVGASGTAITQIRVYSQALDVASTSANTSAEQTFTVTGLTTGDKVFVNKPTASAGLGVVNARVSATDTLAITFGNFTGSGIDPASETYTIVAIRS